MSGGAFDYAQYRIADIYTEIEDEIYGHHLNLATLPFKVEVTLRLIPRISPP